MKLSIPNQVSFQCLSSVNRGKKSCSPKTNSHNVIRFCFQFHIKRMVSLSTQFPPQFNCLFSWLYSAQTVLLYCCRCRHMSLITHVSFSRLSDYQIMSRKYIWINRPSHVRRVISTLILILYLTQWVNGNRTSCHQFVWLRYQIVNAVGWSRL